MSAAPARAAAAASMITILPFGARRQPLRADPLTVASPSQHALPLRTAAARLVQLRVQRAQRFFHRRAEQHEVFAQLSPAARITHKARQLLALFSRSGRAALRAKFHALCSRASVVRAARGVVTAIRNAIKRLRGSHATELLIYDVTQQQSTTQRRTYLRRVTHALARLGRDLLRTKQRTKQRAQVRTFACAVANDQLLSATQVARIAGVIVAQRNAEAQQRYAAVIQRAWRQLRRSQLVYNESKTRLLALLTVLTPELQQHDERIRTHQHALQSVCEHSITRILHGASRRLAARRIQRVWRGHCARKRVLELCNWRRKRKQQQLQRVRLQKAREALLQPSEREQQQLRAVAQRAQSRLQKTPLVLRSGSRQCVAAPLTHARATLLEPLPLQNPPPRISAFTCAKTQRVPFATFEKICAQHARVTAANLWVAIPVGYGDVGAAIAQQPQARRAKRNRFLAAQYDWLPATLLQQPQPHSQLQSER